MRAAPPVRITLNRFGVWHGLLVLLATFSIVALTAWAALRSTPLEAFAWLGVMSAGLACATLAATLRARPVHLAWDGQCWRVGPAATAPESLPIGRLAVRMDLGPWLLLRFEPTQTSHGGSRWLPVQRGGLASAQWHALRCALYATVPASAATDDPAAEV